VVTGLLNGALDQSHSSPKDRGNLGQNVLSNSQNDKWYFIFTFGVYLRKKIKYFYHLGHIFTYIFIFVSNQVMFFHMCSDLLLLISDDN